MQQAMRVIKETHSIERKRRQTSRKKKSDETTARKQRAKTLIVDVKRGGMRKEEIEARIEEIFGKGSSQEIVNATTKDKIVERIEELSKREQQFDQ